MERTYLAVACANSQEVLGGNLLLSPDVRDDRLPCRAIFDTRSAASAYAAVVEERPADVLVFVHQDVFLPQGWLDQLRRAVSYLDDNDPNWAVIGSYGAAKDGTHVGHLYDVSNRRVAGAPVAQLTPVSMLDEIIIALRVDSGVTFDPGLPGYHMYGTQICLAAAEHRKGVYVADLPVVHNSKSVQTLDASFGDAWRYISRRWKAQLPVPNLMCRTMDGTPWPLWRWRVHNRIQLWRGKRKLYKRADDVQAIAREFGFDRIPDRLEKVRPVEPC